MTQGEFVYFVGKVGSGKTSLLKTVYGELDIQSGEAEVMGFDLRTIKQKHIHLILKLNCYREIRIDGETDPDPAKTAEIMRDRYVYIMTGESMILSEPDDTHLTLFNPDDELLELVKLIASGEGLFVWRAEA